LIGFLIGLVISLIAAVPAFLLQRVSETDMKTRLKLWGIGLVIRFGIIGVALFFLFTQTMITRIPTVIGVAIAFFTLFIIENTVLRRA